MATTFAPSCRIEIVAAAKAAGAVATVEAAAMAAQIEFGFIAAGPAQNERDHERIKRSRQALGAIAPQCRMVATMGRPGRAAPAVTPGVASLFASVYGTSGTTTPGAR